jgi:hypothetical protein
MRTFTAGAMLAVTMLFAGPAGAATPPSGTIAPGGELAWTGDTFAAGANVSNFTGDQKCFPSYPGGPSDPESTPAEMCDVFEFTVDVPPGYWGQNKGGVSIAIDWSASGDENDDFDMYVYRKPPPGQPVGPALRASAQGGTTEEHTRLTSPEGTYLVRTNPFTVSNSGFKGTIKFFSLNPIPSVPGGLDQFRASSTGYLSYSEPHIAVNPLEPNHLVALSKKYQNLAEYKFKVGSFLSVDGGRTWQDQGFLPGYPAQKGDEGDDYHVTSDPWVAFDDEGNAFAMVLDHPPGSLTGAGWGMTLHRSLDGGRTWSGRVPIEEKNDPITKLLLISDKNTLVVDNFGPDRDGKTGNMYACWSEDAPVANVFVAVKRSTDAGLTWGPNPPLNVSGADRTVIGCHVVVGPPTAAGGPGVVYVFWNDFSMERIRVAKSTNGGQVFGLPADVVTYRSAPSPFPNSAFRNLNVPAAAVDPRDGTVYLSYVDYHATAPDEECPETVEEAPPPGQVCDADVMLVKSTDGGATWRPIRVNKDPLGDGKDQFQQQLAISEDGQLNMMWFDRRNDPQNFYIDTVAARSNDGGATWSEFRVTRSMWDPSINPPISPSGEFIGDYQGMAANRCAAFPFWNDTTLANLPASDPRYSPYQEVFSAELPNSEQFGGTGRPASCERPTIVAASGCLNKIGNFRGKSVGRARLGRTRTRHRRLFKGARLRARRGFDRYCIEGGGALRIGYPTRRLNRSLGRSQRRRVRSRAIAILVTSRRFSIRRIRAGSSVRALRRRLRGERRVRVGSNSWYVVAGKRSRLLFKTRGGRVREIGIADKRLTRTRVGQRRLLRAWQQR